MLYIEEMSIHIGIFHADNDERYLNKKFSLIIFFTIQEKTIFYL